MDDWRWAMGDGVRVMGDGRLAMGDGRWAMDDGRWAMDDWRGAMGDGRWGMAVFIEERREMTETRKRCHDGAVKKCRLLS